MSDEETEINRDALKRIEADAPRGGGRHALSNAYPEVGILREEHSGPGFRRYVREQFNWPGADRTNVAVEIVKRATVGHLVNAYNDKQGRQALLQLYDALTDKPGNQTAQLQADRILAVFGTAGGMEAMAGSAEKTWVVPARFTFLDPANLQVSLTSEGKVHLKINNQATDRFLVEAARSGLPVKVFGAGVTIPPEKWVRIKLHDEGGVTVARPALYLLRMGKACDQATWNKVYTVGALALSLLPGGVAGGAGGLFTRGAPRVAERALDLLARAIPAGQVVVTETKGWLIKNYGDKARALLEAWDKFALGALVYGGVKLVAMGAGRSVAEAWKAIRSDARALSRTDRTMFDALDAAVNRLTATAERAEQAVRGERPTAARDLARATARRDTVPDGLSDTLPGTGPLRPSRRSGPPSGRPPPPRDTVPDGLSDTLPGTGLLHPSRRSSPPSGRPTPPRHDTLPDAFNTTPPAGQPPPLSPQPGARPVTPPPLNDRQLSLLGTELGRHAAQYGLQGEALDQYIWVLTKQAGVRRGLDPRLPASQNALRPDVQRLMADQITRASAVGPELTRRLADYGFNAQDVALHLEHLQGLGRSLDQVKAGLAHELKLMDVLRDRYCHGDVARARTIINATEESRSALRHVISDRLLNEWRARYPNRVPGDKNLRRFGREAKRQVDQLDRELRGQRPPEASLLRRQEPGASPAPGRGGERSLERGLAAALRRQAPKPERPTTEPGEAARRRLRGGRAFV